MNIPENLVRAAVRTIITTRDFCGNEREAVFDLAHDNGITGADAQKLHRIANFRANAEWNGWKKAAGVNPKHTW